jgi:hypothetical protein
MKTWILDYLLFYFMYAYLHLPLVPEHLNLFKNFMDNLLNCLKNFNYQIHLHCHPSVPLCVFRLLTSNIRHDTISKMSLSLQVSG